MHVEALDLVAVEVEDVDEPVLRADDEELLMGADAADAVAREHLGHVEADAAVLEQRLDLIIVVDIWLRLRHPGPEPPRPRTLVPSSAPSTSDRSLGGWYAGDKNSSRHRPPPSSFS